MGGHRSRQLHRGYQSDKDRQHAANGNDEPMLYSPEYGQDHEQQEQDIDFHYFVNNSFATALIVFPSAWPANCRVATPITFPISAGADAPVSAMIFATAAFKACSSSCFGRNRSIIPISSSSFLARSGRFCCW